MYFPVVSRYRRDGDGEADLEGLYSVGDADRAMLTRFRIPSVPLAG